MIQAGTCLGDRPIYRKSSHQTGNFDCNGASLTLSPTTGFSRVHTNPTGLRIKPVWVGIPRLASSPPSFVPVAAPGKDIRTLEIQHPQFTLLGVRDVSKLSGTHATPNGTPDILLFIYLLPFSPPTGQRIPPKPDFPQISTL